MGDMEGFGIVFNNIPKDKAWIKWGRKQSPIHPSIHKAPYKHRGASWARHSTCISMVKYNIFEPKRSCMQWSLFFKLNYHHVSIQWSSEKKNYSRLWSYCHEQCRASDPETCHACENMGPPDDIWWSPSYKTMVMFLFTSQISFLVVIRHRCSPFDVLTQFEAWAIYTACIAVKSD